MTDLIKQLQERATILFKTVDPDAEVEVEIMYEVTIKSKLQPPERKGLYDVEFTLLEEFPSLYMDFIFQDQEE